VQFSVSGAASYVWEPAELFATPYGTGQTLTIIEPTTVVVYGTDANGCVNSASATVNVHEPPTATVSATEAPNAVVTVAISGGTPPYTVRLVGFGVNAVLTDVQGETSFSGLNAGAYDVLITDANGCRFATFVNVFLPGCNLAVYAGEDRSICAGTTSVLTAEVVGGGTNVEVVWAPASGLSATTGSTVTASPVSTTTYTVTVVSGICTTVDVVTVEVRPVPAVGAYTTTPTVCAGSSATLNALGAGSFVWMPGNLVGATVTVSPAQTTTYTVTGTSLGCSSVATVTVNVRPLPDVSAQTDRSVICVGESATLSATGGVSYRWSPPTGLSNPFVANPTASPVSTTTYTVSARNEFGCESVATVQIEVNPVPTAAIYGDGEALCYGQTTQITALEGPGYTYEWQPASQILGSNDQSFAILAPTQTTIYTLTVTNEVGCTSTATYAQSVYPPSQTIAFAPMPAICVGQSAPLFASGAVSYRWEPQSGLSNAFVFNPIANPAQTTTYTVFGTDANGCTTADSITLTVHPLPQIVTPANPTICLGQSVQLSVEGADVFVWQPTTGLD
ncbi:MAG: hypothetical protein RMM53_11545, partial [Bacteroidia bacterium]|nr:hypothetical protein [Bacteroidia bacterium]